MTSPFIEASPMTPYFQSGEVKYGKPILDRILTPEIGLGAAAKLALASFDVAQQHLGRAADRSRLLPPRQFHRAVAGADRAEDDAYFQSVRRSWNDGLARVFAGIDDLVL